jgi:hypothetical protein
VFLSARELQLHGVIEEIGIAVGSSEDGSEDNSSISQHEEDT